MNNNVLEKKKRAEGLTSIGLLNSGPFLTSYQSADTIRRGISSLHQALLIYRERDIRRAFPEESRKGEADVIFNLHYSCLKLEQHTEVIAYLQQALSLYQTLQDKASEAKTLENISFIYSDLNQHSQAIRYMNQAVGLYRTTDATRECKALNNLGIACSKAELFKEAIWSYQQATELAQQLGNVEEQILPLTNLAVAYCSIQDYSQATYCYEQASLLAQRIGDFSRQAEILQILGVLHHYNNQTQLGDEYLQRAKIARESPETVIRPVPGNDRSAYIRVSFDEEPEH
ncbi:MAG: tetratricopeptide repeat protein [Cyanobacteria bacterium P01_D01_bin.1]